MTESIKEHQTKGLATPGDMMSYEQARAYAAENGIKSMRQWFDFHNPRKGGVIRPRNVPGDPSKYYGRRDLWKGWPDFLGTETKATQVQRDEFLGLEATKQWFIDNKITTVTQFREISKNGMRPDDIHSAPDKKFEVKFSELLCPKEDPYLTFEEARDFVKPYKFTSYLEFREGRRNDEALKVVPCNPDKHYDKVNKWTSWPDFLGYSRIK
ncbi:TPA: hypothetical protein ACGSTL_001441 [Vibrio parahaemolyticus]|uniref:hypothetical protein n=1 Tax=Vibrio campbellii TaxID=680 RepID=UPI001F08692F|nr:hypothetical protein [Vibrio campbellii]UMM06572.1 hypothetical protein MKR81_26865 [Vibrio campbellii]